MTLVADTHPADTPTDISHAPELGWRQQIAQCLSTGPLGPETLHALMGFLVRLERMRATFAFVRRDQGPLVPATPMLAHPEYQASTPNWHGTIQHTIREMCVQGRSYATASLGSDGRLLVASVGPPRQPEIVLGIVAEPQATHIPYLLEATAATLASQMAPATDPACSESISWEQRFQLLWQVCQGRDPAQAYHELALALVPALDVATVWIGRATGKGRCRVAGCSAQPKLASAAPLVGQAQELMSEAILLDVPREVRDGATMTDAESEFLATTRAAELIVGPLRDEEGQAVGAWIVLPQAKDLESTHEPDPSRRENGIDGDKGDNEKHSGPKTDLASWAPLVASAIALVQRTRRPWYERAWHSWYKGWSRQRLLLVAAVAGILALPVPHRLGCDVELQPVRKRLVLAPFEGILDEVLIEPGEVVTKGQVIARMDGQQLRWELAGARAQRHRYEKEYDTATALGDTAAAQVARLQADQFDVDIQLLQRQMAQMEIKSPMAGRLLSGDPRQLEGSRLSTGQTLFEIGPLDQLIAEVRIPDSEVAMASPGDLVRMRMEAYPYRVWTGALNKILPQAQVIDQENVFLAEVDVDNEDVLLRPGMKGQAAVMTGWRPLAWKLFHGTVDRLRFLLWT